MKKAERDALYQKHRSIRGLAAVTADTADIVLMRVLVTDPLTNRRGQVRPHGASGACVGVLEAKGPSGEGRWPCVENVEYVFLRRGAYLTRIAPRAADPDRPVIQVKKGLWSDILIHPTSHWVGLRGCISPGISVDESKKVITASKEAHKELLNVLGYDDMETDKFTEFTLYVVNNPPGYGEQTADEWIRSRLPRWWRRREERRRARQN